MNTFLGTANRAVQGKTTTVGDVAVDGLIGGSFAAIGKVSGNALEKGLDRLSNHAKGKLGEAVTEVKYA